jgi:hypothetical protein
LADAPLEEYEEAFTTIAEVVFRPRIENENVFTELFKSQPPALHSKILGRLVRQSEGSIRTTGEVNEPITWIKVANAPTAEAAEWLRKVLPAVDKKDGVWEVVIQGDSDRIELVQLRGGISLQSLIDRIDIPDNPVGWALLIAHAPDPVSATLVPPNPSPRQYRRVLAKALANGQLTISQNGCFVFRSSSSEQITLGPDPSSVEAFLQPRWRELVFVESTFGRNLVVDEDPILSALKNLKAQLASGSAGSNPVLKLIDGTAVEECLTQAQLLLPRLRRMRIVGSGGGLA